MHLAISGSRSRMSFRIPLHHFLQIMRMPSEMSDEFVIQWEIEEVSKLPEQEQFSPFHHHSSMCW